VPALPPGTDVALTAAWIREVLSGAVPVPAPIATQIETIRGCLRESARVSWVSPL